MSEWMNQGLPKRKTQLRLLIGPLILFAWVSPSSEGQPNAVWRWRARMHTHHALGIGIWNRVGKPYTSRSFSRKA